MPEDSNVQVQRIPARVYFPADRYPRRGDGAITNTPIGLVNPDSVVEVYAHANGYTEVWIGDQPVESFTDEDRRAVFLEERRLGLAERQEARQAQAEARAESREDRIAKNEEARLEIERERLALQQQQAATAETPEQRLARERALETLRQSGALAQIQAQAQAEYQQWHDKLAREIELGIKLPEDARIELETQARLIVQKAEAEAQQALVQEQSRLRQEESAAAFERERPFREAEQRRAEEGLALQQRGLEQSAQQAAFERQQAGAQAQLGVLQQQAQAGQSLVQGLVGAGVAPSAGTVRFAFSPLQMAMQVANRLVQEGVVDPSHLPLPSAPRPASAPPAPPPPMAASAPPPRTLDVVNRDMSGAVMPSRPTPTQPGVR